jgi:branched-chain amino acid transport system ATP-binding protein
MNDRFIIDAQEINAWYGASHAVRGVEFRVRRGETLALMGRNGMGKTTLLRSLLGLLRAPVGRSDGRVRVSGVDMSGARPHRIARAGIAYVPEGRGIFPNLTVRENLVMAARPREGHSTRPWTLERVLTTFPRLAERMSHGGGQLSGGEQQMLTIGRALMTNPDCLILDEATEGLAPLIAREIWAIVKSIREDGIATVIVDKNFEAVSALADRAQVLVKGRTEFEGHCAALREDAVLRQKLLGV